MGALTWGFFQLAYTVRLTAAQLTCAVQTCVVHGSTSQLDTPVCEEPSLLQRFTTEGGWRPQPHIVQGSVIALINITDILFVFVLCFKGNFMTQE